ncbi:zinc finger BED domain-containing protein RICESLEEPER 2-like [Pistacia vera]|uniref:zinc finger BED domain-containing protein RICESLEEPER 2-like n=1 Tax=Pistacia vera TaxID=55513 RepID=UPI0012634D0A|nr:zinc finger BED domain-containing protein RICESLEEPER 2-like [Pistacia vera]
MRQHHISFSSAGNDVATTILPALSGKFDMLKMRELIAHWVLMHEHPFTIVEEEGLNNMMKFWIPEWTSVSRHTCKKDCMKVYESEKAKLKNVTKVSLTIDLWNSGNQKMEYMVLTGHWIDSTRRLNRHILNFVHLPPPRTGIEIADDIFKCLMGWGIESKVYTISVDYASSNDVAIKALKENFEVLEKLLCGDGLYQIRHIIDDIHESVFYINSSESRLKVFYEIIQQLKLPYWKLILHCKTRWNYAYEMLATTIKFKKVFPRLKERDTSYHNNPSDEDWEKVYNILKVFSGSTKLISGSDYQTSNLFLKEVCVVKCMLDGKSESEDDFIRVMVRKVKEKFNKYWGECNVLMSVAAILDPRLKMRVIQWAFPKMYSEAVARANMMTVRDALYDLYEEYV